MSRLRLGSVLLMAIAVILLVACGSKQERACASLLKARMATDSTPSGTVARSTFWSAKLETCVLVEVSQTGVEFAVDDLSDSFLQTMKLFYCDRAGVDAVILDSVRAYQGNVWTVRYDQWLSDGEGGPPRAIHTPSAPFDAAKCRTAMTKFLTLIE